MATSPVVTALYVPGDRPERFDKAHAAGPDVVIVDLEDAVAPDRKGFARQAVVEYLGALHPGVLTHIRINGRHTPWWHDDLAAVAGLPGLDGLRVPKVESADDLCSVAQLAPGVELHALIESATGIQAMAAIAAAGSGPAGASSFRVGSIGLGEADLSSDLGVADDVALDPIRVALVVAARAAGLDPPMMSVWTALDDEAGLLASCQVGRARGFLGRTAIHPRQLPAIRAAFRPSSAELDAARVVLAALDAAARDGAGVVVTPDGHMVDKAMRPAAERVVRLAAHLAATHGD